MKSVIVCLLLLSSLSMAWATEEKRRELPKKIKAQVVEVLRANEAMHRAFFDFNEKKVKASADEMMALVKRIGMSPVKRPMTLMRGNLEDIKKAASREQFNEAYAELSKHLISMIKEYNVGPHYNVYSCPMIKKKWVQDSSQRKRVHNPFAPEMPHCGQRDTDY